jgi:nucleotide-binding universal stress UspA family protein
MTVVREPKMLFEGVYLSFQLDQMVAEARSNLDKIVRKFRTTEVLIEQDVRFGSIGHEILTAARDRDIDLIVMASHRPEMLDYLIGPNAAHVARHAGCSVLILRRFSKNPAASAAWIAT